MKICWDNLERFEGMNKNGRLYTKPYKYGNRMFRTYYRIVDECAWCKEPFITRPGRDARIYCCRKCYSDATRSHLAGRRVGPVKIIERIGFNPDRKEHLWKCVCDCGNEVVKGTATLKKEVTYCSSSCKFNYKDIKGQRFGKVVAKKMVGKDATGKSVWLFHCDCGKDFEAPSASFTRSNAPVRSCGCLSLPFGFSLTDKGLVSYDLFRESLECAERLSYDIVEEYDDFKLLKVRCTYCDKWFVPEIHSVYRRVWTLEGKVPGEQRFYCSDDCKESCSIFGKVKWAQGCAPQIADYCNEWDEKLRVKIKERDGYKCLNPSCYGTNGVLSIHHIDYDKKNCEDNNLITVCTACNTGANANREWHTAWYRAVMQKRYGYTY